MDTKTAASSPVSFSTTLVKWLLALAVLAALAIAAYALRDRWWPPASEFVGLAPPPPAPAKNSHNHGSPLPPQASLDDAHGDHTDGAHGHDDHGHAGHKEAESIEISQQARKNISLKTEILELETFVRTVTMPAIVVAPPGRSQIEITAPLGGHVTRVYAIEGEAVRPGEPLFDVHLTHEELVQSQTELLESVEKLDVELREIARLQEIVDSGAIPAKRVLERQYEKQKLEAAINAQRQSLLLHGLSQEQVDSIIEDRMLIQGLTVTVPERAATASASEQQAPLTLRTLHVKPGTHVEAGAPLCLLVDYGELYIEGHAFEQDSDELLRAAQEGWPITAILEDKNGSRERLTGLSMVYVDSEVDPTSRALHFYVGLPNEVVHESQRAGGHTFLTWKYKPGARMQLLVPVEEWPERIVLPTEAVAKEGAEYYVFQQNGNHFDRIPVHVEYQDQFHVVIAADGSLFPGDTVAVSGAHQLQMALKNKAGGGVDPHAGHSH